MLAARAQRYAEARKLLRGVAEPPDLAPRIAFHRLQAAIASGLGEGGVAADQMLAALALAPDDPGLLLASAAAELQAGRLEQALAHAQQASARANTAQAAALTGDIQEKRGAFVEAAQAYRDAVRLAPVVEQYRIALALEFVQHQSFPQAIEVLEAALPAFPQSAKLRALLGVARYATVDLDQAMQALTDAVALNPALEPAYVYLARIALESSSVPPARTVDALCRWNAVVCGAMRLRAARESNNPALRAEAIASLRKAPPDNPVAHCELGRAYEWSREWQTAREQMESCVKLDPSPPNHYRLGLIYSQLGLPGLARKQMELRTESLRKLSADAARRLAAVEAFR